MYQSLLNIKFSFMMCNCTNATWPVLAQMCTFSPKINKSSLRMLQASSPPQLSSPARLSGGPADTGGLPAPTTHAGQHPTALPDVAGVGQPGEISPVRPDGNTSASRQQQHGERTRALLACRQLYERAAEQQARLAVKLQEQLEDEWQARTFVARIPAAYQVAGNSGIDITDHVTYLFFTDHK